MTTFDSIIFFFCVSTCAKPECDNVLQPEPQSSEGCNTLSHSGLAKVATQKRMFYPLNEKQKL